MQDKSNKNHGITDNFQNAGQQEKPASGNALLESVSALMDGEASPLELRRIVKASSQNPDVNAAWQRYHLIRASLQQEVHSRPEVNLLSGINARLAQEQPLALPLGRRIGGFFRKAGQVAVAASVAFTVIYSASYMEVALQQGSDGADTANTIAANAAGTAVQNSSDLPVLNGNFTPSQLTRTVSMDAATRNRIQRAVYQFSENQQVPLEPYTFPEELDSEQLPVQP